MVEIAAVRGSNGLSLVSTFSGCGGSCLGFEMAGYRVLWANEFVPAARETYARNHPGVVLDGRDIREVKPEEILEVAGLRVGELDVLEGSPPCASFSVVGKRERDWGKVKKYSDVEQRTDDLFFEYARILRGLMPKVFVAENVSGLVKGSSWGYFEEILRELRACGYRVRARVLDAQWLGVPQTRPRLIFVGVRDDLSIEPVHPSPLTYRYTVRDALAELRHDPNELAGHELRFSPRAAFFREWKSLLPGVWSDRYINFIRASPALPCPAVTAEGGAINGAASVTHPSEPRKFTIPELKRICSFPDDFELTGTFKQRWERLGRSVPPVMMFRVARTLRDEIFAKLAPLPKSACEAMGASVVSNERGHR